MKAPEIRYPLFWILGIGFLGLLGWGLWPLTQPARHLLREGWRRVVEGPPVPASSEPAVFVGVLPRRVLLLSGDQPVTDRPGGRAVEVISRRIFADLYDTWPLEPTEPPTHYRIGNLRPFGWVEARSVLPWNTRLTLKRPETRLDLAREPGGETQGLDLEPGSILPVLDGSGHWIKVAVWHPGKAWEQVLTTGWTPIAENDPDLGVLISRPELLQLIRGLLGDQDRSMLRLESLLGIRLRGDAADAENRALLNQSMPSWAMGDSDQPVPEDVLRGLSTANEQWTTELSWSGLHFRHLPLRFLP